MSNQANSKRISEWSKENHVSSEVVLRLLRDRGVEVRSFMSVVEVAQYEAIRSAALAEQEKIDKKSHVKKTSPPVASGAPRPVSNASSDAKKETTKRDVGSGGKQIKVTLHRGGSDTPKPAQAARPVPVAKPVESPVVEKPAEVVAPVAAKAEIHAAPSVAQPVQHDKKVEAQTEKPHHSASEKPAPAKPAPVKPVAEKQVSDKPVTEKQNVPEKAAPAPAPEAPRTAPMKATVEKPNAEMLARIQKYQQQQAQQRGGGRGPGGPGGQNRGPGGPGGGGGRPPGAQGYTGSFGRSANGGNAPVSNAPAGGPGGPGGQNRGPGGPGRGPGGPGRGPGGPGRPGGFGNTMQDAMVGAGFEQAAKGGGGGGPGRSAGGAKGKKGAKGGRPQPKEQTKEQINVARQNVSRVMASLSKNPVKKTYRKEASEDGPVEGRQVLKTSDFITVGELAGLMEQMPAKVIAKCMEMGMMVTINHRLDFETIQVLADEFGYDAELMEEYEEENLGIEVETEDNLIHRSPIVTVMGHVDHGKTSLLDYVRRANVVSGESGGITQHIGAYEVVTPQGNVTFLDTPGHEAFSAMRARGSQVTDVIVLVVASDSMVMPQTVECIELAKNAKVPIVVAITKIDLPTANPDKIRAQLAERGVEVEQWGGQTSCVEVSSRTGQGMERLLEILALETEVLDLRANPNAHARGTVVESRLDPGKGAIATILIQNGTLHVGDVFVCGNHSGRVRAMYDHFGKPRKEAGPSVPCQLLGFDGTPQAGDDLVVFEDEKQARSIASNRRMAARERELRFRKHMSLEQVYDRVKTGEFSELNLIVKADVDGSAEAIAASLEKLTNREVKINIIRKAVGAVNDSDILLASTADAVIVAFHLMPSISIREMAEREGVEIKTYRIIYEIIEEIQGVVEGMLKPTTKEQLVGEAEIREVFKIPKIGIIAGCMVRDGVVDRESHVRVYREGVEMGITHVQSLKRHKDDASSVKEGMECGIGLRGYDDIQVGDSLIFFKEVKVARTLADVASDAADAAKAAALIKAAKVKVKHDA